jgi:alpha-glucoside transport system substrate-binding protein
MTLRISLLGKAQLSRNDRTLALPGYRPFALLAYLLIRGKPQSREHLVHLLFDRPNDPRAALRWTLTQLRKTVGADVILADRQEIAFSFQSDHWLDVSAFEAGDLSLYRGQLLEGLDLRDARLYNSWLLVERERLRALYQARLEQRLQQQWDVDDAASVEKTTLLLLQLDNLREEWHRALMSAYTRQGKFDAAKVQYELCRQILAEELHLEPAPATVTLLNEIERAQSDHYTRLAKRANSSLVQPGMVTEHTVTLAGRLTAKELKLLKKSLRPFEKKTDISIKIGVFPDDFEQVLPSLVYSGLVPDILQITQPGLVAKFVRAGQVVDVRTFMNEAFLRQQYSQALLKAAMIDDRMAGVWHKSNIKSLVWYPKNAFEKAGYEVPRSWKDLMKLSDQIVADGRTPWCIGIESGAASGWVGTDWVEDILLRTAPPEKYDAWVGGELPFDSPEIRRVFAIMKDIWLDDAYVCGGRAAILSEPFFESVLHLFEQPPGCFLHKQSSFILEFFPEDAVCGQEYDLFYLPPIDPKFGKPVLGAGDMMVMFNDRPEVREVMRYLTTAESVRHLVGGLGVISPHRDAPFEWYSSTAQLKVAQILFDADTYRFDGSDSMPPEVGTESFLKGIVAWVEGKDLGSVLRGIDDSWPGKKRL